MTQPNQTDKNNGAQPPAGAPGPAPVVAKIQINLHSDGGVTCNYPTDPKMMFYMVCKFLEMAATRLRYEAPSSIVQLPPGFRVG